VTKVACGSCKYAAAAAAGLTVSIARRLQDPLAELIKIDPKNIGVGMYQVGQLISCFVDVIVISVCFILRNLLTYLLCCSVYCWLLFKMPVFVVKFS